MALPRSWCFSPFENTYVHCMSRVVRRSWLCGNDPYTGKNFDHRRRWLIDRARFLSGHFAIDVCSYAIMSNHYHLVLHVDMPRAQSMSDEEVIGHGLALFPGKKDDVEFLNAENPTEAQQEGLDKLVAEWRTRLSDISWYMRCLNEYIARLANREDDCTGRFWEGRFKSQTLLDEKALLTCMAYVDLNPLRAGAADSLENSDFTSIQERLFEIAKRSKNRNARQNRLLNRGRARHLRNRNKGGASQDFLKPFSGMQGISGDTLPIEEESYIELLESTAKALGLLKKKDEGGALQLLNENRESLDCVGIGPGNWLDAAQNIHKFHGTAIGSKQALEAHHHRMKEKGAIYKHKDKWTRGVGPAKKLFES